jgi:hypothetical protein
LAAAAFTPADTSGTDKLARQALNNLVASEKGHAWHGKCSTANAAVRREVGKLTGKTLPMS